MKVSNYFFWMFLIIYPLGCQACSSKIEECAIKDTIDDVVWEVQFIKDRELYEEYREREKIFKENFVHEKECQDTKNGKYINSFHCITPSEKYVEVNNKISRLVDYFWYDGELRRSYIAFLWKVGQFSEALDQIARLVLLAPCFAHYFIFMDYLKDTTLNKCLLEKYIKEIDKFRCGKSTSINFTENAFLLLQKIQCLDNPVVYDATLATLDAQLLQDGHSKIASELIHKLYNQQRGLASPHLKVLYAIRILMPNQYYEKAATEIYESMGLPATKVYESMGLKEYDDLDPSIAYHTGANCNMLGICYLKMAQSKSIAGNITDIKHSPVVLDDVKRAENWLTSSFSCTDPRPIMYHNLSFVYLVLGQTEQAFINIKEITKKHEDAFSVYNLKHSDFQRLYELILQKSGRIQELNSILLKKQKKIIEAIGKHKEMVALIKVDQMQRHQKVEARHQSRLEASQQQPLPQLVKQRISGPSYMAESSMLTQISKGDGARPKKKKQNAPSVLLQYDAPVASAAAPLIEAQEETQKLFIFIEALTSNKNAQKTFCNLFAKDVTGKYEKISLNEINYLFKAIRQDIDPSKGKGSHKKVTLNFQNQGINMKEQTVILSKTTYLKPEQIKDIRLAFINAGIIPNDEKIINGLRKDGVLK